MVFGGRTEGKSYEPGILDQGCAHHNQELDVF